jgi:hypothetical protein
MAAKKSRVRSYSEMLGLHVAQVVDAHLAAGGARDAKSVEAALKQAGYSVGPPGQGVTPPPAPPPRELVLNIQLAPPPPSTKHIRYDAEGRIESVSEGPVQAAGREFREAATEGKTPGRLRWVPEADGGWVGVVDDRFEGDRRDFAEVATDGFTPEPLTKQICTWLNGRQPSEAEPRELAAYLRSRGRHVSTEVAGWLLLMVDDHRACPIV